MRIVRYCYRNQESYGVLNQQTVLSLPALAKRFREEVPQTLEVFIKQAEGAMKTAEKLIEKAGGRDVAAVSVPLSEVTLLAPIAFPPKIICLGLNYFDHAAETNSRVPDEPVIFMKPHTAITGPNMKIIKPQFVKELDYEGELCIVMGKTAKNVSAAEAKNHVFGYTVFNDVSARDFQFKDGQWTRGKSFDTFAPTGPCITTENQLRNTEDLAIRTWVNGELRQNGTTRNMVFNVSQIVHQLSRVMTLEPCDLIATGTPAGVGMALKPKNWLKNGDVVRVEIEGVGILENTVDEQG
ncbi:fumarylacetoacetate hydrolase family protein [Candidatus Bathyarchaeota archaeon A05DMB-2]|nr:fumarylacetoacetate hydrolase family protein [Candidatus Bathyarchaeota archaeon A05DMB-2]